MKLEQMKMLFGQLGQPPYDLLALLRIPVVL
ncbi:hypothetical protein LINPERHAP2_LOCUS37602 [Linum perenne]